MFYILFFVHLCYPGFRELLVLESLGNTGDSSRTDTHKHLLLPFLQNYFYKLLLVVSFWLVQRALTGFGVVLN